MNPASLPTSAVASFESLPRLSEAVGPVAEALERAYRTRTAWAAGRPNVSRSDVDTDRTTAAREARRFELKAYFATVAMHIDEQWRASLFKQIDLMLGADDLWDEDDPLPALQSWHTFVRLVIYSRFLQRPSLTVFEGRIAAIWQHEHIRITIECLPNDNVRWVGSRNSPEGSREAAAGEATLKRVKSYLSAFDVSEWLYDG